MRIGVIGGVLPDDHASLAFWAFWINSCSPPHRPLIPARLTVPKPHASALFRLPTHPPALFPLSSSQSDAALRSADDEGSMSRTTLPFYGETLASPAAQATRVCQDASPCRLPLCALYSALHTYVSAICWQVASTRADPPNGHRSVSSSPSPCTILRRTSKYTGCSENRTSFYNDRFLMKGSHLAIVARPDSLLFLKLARNSLPQAYQCLSHSRGGITVGITGNMPTLTLSYLATLSGIGTAVHRLFSYIIAADFGYWHPYWYRPIAWFLQAHCVPLVSSQLRIGVAAPSPWT